MNVKRILPMFVFFVLIIACTSVAFASENIDDPQFSEEFDLNELDYDLDEHDDDLNEDTDSNEDESDLDEDSELEYEDDFDLDDYDMENYDFKYDLLNLNVMFKAYSSRLGSTTNSNYHSVNANETKKDSNSNNESVKYTQKAKSVLKSINLPDENQNTNKNQSNDDKNTSEDNNNEKSNNNENKQGNNYLTILSIILILILAIICI